MPHPPPPCRPPLRPAASRLAALADLHAALAAGPEHRLDQTRAALTACRWVDALQPDGWRTTLPPLPNSRARPMLWDVMYAPCGPVHSAVWFPRPTGWDARATSALLRAFGEAGVPVRLKDVGGLNDTIRPDKVPVVATALREVRGGPAPTPSDASALGRLWHQVAQLRRMGATGEWAALVRPVVDELMPLTCALSSALGLGPLPPSLRPDEIRSAAEARAILERREHLILAGRTLVGTLGDVANSNNPDDQNMAHTLETALQLIVPTCTDRMEVLAHLTGIGVGSFHAQHILGWTNYAVPGGGAAPRTGEEATRRLAQVESFVRTRPGWRAAWALLEEQRARRAARAQRVDWAAAVNELGGATAVAEATACGAVWDVLGWPEAWSMRLRMIRAVGCGADAAARAPGAPVVGEEPTSSAAVWRIGDRPRMSPGAAPLAWLGLAVQGWNAVGFGGATVWDLPAECYDAHLMRMGSPRAVERVLEDAAVRRAFGPLVVADPVRAFLAVQLIC